MNKTLPSKKPGYEFVRLTVTRKGKTYTQWFQRKIKVIPELELGFVAPVEVPITRVVPRTVKYLGFELAEDNTQPMAMAAVRRFMASSEPTLRLVRWTGVQAQLKLTGEQLQRVYTDAMNH